MERWPCIRCPFPEFVHQGLCRIRILGPKSGDGPDVDDIRHGYGVLDEEVYLFQGLLILTLGKMYLCHHGMERHIILVFLE